MLWWSVQLNLLGGTWKGQAFLAAIALDLREQGSWLKDRNVTSVPAKRWTTEPSHNRRQQRVPMRCTITNTLVIGNSQEKRTTSRQQITPSGDRCLQRARLPWCPCSKIHVIC